MPKNRIFKRKESLGFIIKLDSCPILIDEEGEFWLGGSSSLVGVAVFKDKFEARSIRTLIKNRWEGIRRTKIYEIFSVESKG